jgi:hypothetical protein
VLFQSNAEAMIRKRQFEVESDPDAWMASARMWSREALLILLRMAQIFEAMAMEKPVIFTSI